MRALARFEIETQLRSALGADRCRTSPEGYINRVTPVRFVYLFGSHARGEARPDSDVDLCVVADGAERQQDTARRYREAIWSIWPRPSLTLIPIAPTRFA